MKIITKPGSEKEYLLVTPSEALQIAQKIRKASLRLTTLKPVYLRAEDMRKVESQPLQRLYVWYQYLLYQYSLLPETPEMKRSKTLIAAHLKEFVVTAPFRHTHSKKPDYATSSSNKNT